MKKNKIEKILCLLFFIAVLFFIENKAFAKLELSDADLITLSKNGVISSMCYVYNLITGSLARIIISIFVMAAGWGFVVAGKIEYKTLIPFFIAISLLFGGVEIANLISGNDYLCNFEESSDDSIVENSGYCALNTIQGYASGQTWKKCSNEAGTECNEIITNSSYIDYDNIVSLEICQNGYYKNSLTNKLRYKCKLKGNTGIFTIIDGDDKKLCSPYCPANDLKKFFNNNRFVRPIDKDGILSSSVSTTPKILSGKTVDINKNYSNGATLDVGCYNSEEFNIDGILVNADNIDNYGVRLLCEDGVFSLIGGSCRKSCLVSDIYYSSYVESWKVYKSKNDILNNKYIDIDNSSAKITSGNFIEINNCKSDCSISNSDEKALYFCNFGNWERSDKKTIVDNKEGEYDIDTIIGKKENTICEKSCKISTITNYNKVKTFKQKRKLEKDWISVPYSELAKKLFYNYDFLSISECIDGTIIKPENRSNNNKLDVAEYVCGISGIWTNNNSGEICNNYCDTDDIKNLSDSNIKIWQIYSDSKIAYSNVYDIIEIEDGENKIYTNSNGDTNIYYNEYIRGKECKDGYGIVNIDNLPYYRCDKSTGELKLIGSKIVCKKKCSFTDLVNSIIEDTEGSDLKTASQNVKVFYKCDTEDYNDCKEKKDIATDSIKYTETVIIGECNAGYNLEQGNNYNVFKCSDDGKWKLEQSGSSCK